MKVFQSFVDNFHHAWQWLMCPVEQTMACVDTCKPLKLMYCDWLRLVSIEKQSAPDNLVKSIPKSDWLYYNYGDILTKVTWTLRYKSKVRFKTTTKNTLNWVWSVLLAHSIWCFYLIFSKVLLIWKRLAWKLAFLGSFLNYQNPLSCRTLGYLLLHTLLYISITIWPSSYIRSQAALFQHSSVVSHYFRSVFIISVSSTQRWFARSFSYFKSSY